MIQTDLGRRAQLYSYSVITGPGGVGTALREVTFKPGPGI